MEYEKLCMEGVFLDVKMQVVCKIYIWDVCMGDEYDCHVCLYSKTVIMLCEMVRFD